MSWLTRCIDGFAVALLGGARVRIDLGPDGARATVRGGRVGALSPDRVLRLVLDCEPRAAGVVHVRREGGGRLRVRVGGGLDASFEQRVRNVIGNAS